MERGYRQHKAFIIEYQRIQTVWNLSMLSLLMGVMGWIAEVRSFTQTFFALAGSGAITWVLLTGWTAWRWRDGRIPDDARKEFGG